MFIILLEHLTSLPLLFVKHIEGSEQTTSNIGGTPITNNI